MKKPPTLKSLEEIAALSSSDTYKVLDQTRRDQLVTQITAAQGELAETLPVLLSQSGSASESAFIRDLLVQPAMEVPAVEPEPEVPAQPVEFAKRQTTESDQ